MRPKQKAAAGVELLKEAILEELADHPDGLRNVDVAEALDIHSSYQGGQKDYLSWSLLGILLNEGKVVRDGDRYLRSAGEQ